MIISCEGVDNTGKYTQSAALHEWCSGRYPDREVQFVSFPYYRSDTGQEMQDMLCGDRRYNAREYCRLAARNRGEYWDEWGYSEDDVYIADRYSDSNLAYGMAEGLPYEWIRKLDAKLPKPHHTFWLDRWPVEKSRVADVLEARTSYQALVREYYYILCAMRDNWTHVVVTDINNTQNIIRCKTADVMREAGIMPTW